MRSDNPTAACGLKGILMSFHTFSLMAISLANAKRATSTVVRKDARQRPVIECERSKRLAGGGGEVVQVSVHKVTAGLAPKNDHRDFPTFAILGVL
jgi:hypothetical protein